MICLLARRRLGAFLDGALDTGPSRALARHVDRCLRCHEEIDRLRRMAAMIRQAIPVPTEPDWTGFWPGIVRGVQDGAIRRPVVQQVRWSRRWVIGAAAGVGTLAVVAVAYERLAPFRTGPEETAIVTAADTQYPGGTMVYHAPDNVAVVWVFDE